MKSRTPLEFLRRHGLSLETTRPRPRLAINELLVHTVGLTSPPLPSPEVLIGEEGDPPPDRGLTRPWPAPETE